VVVGAVVGEFGGSDRGLGTLLLRAIGVVNTPLLFAGLIVLTILAVVLFGLIELLERFAIPWRVATVQNVLTRCAIVSVSLFSSNRLLSHFRSWDSSDPSHRRQIVGVPMLLGMRPLSAASFQP
jgi:hypothetical protein